MPAVSPIGEFLQSTQTLGRPGAARGQRLHLLANAQPAITQTHSPIQPMVPHNDAFLNAHAPYDHHNAAQFSTTLVLPAQQMITFQPTSAPPWYHPIHMISSNPYPATPPPPQSTHKVWILDCRSCGTFLTNRGMKAVLLLRPNVPLFSTDALPVNCSAYSSSPETLHGTPPCRPPISQSPPRTCECLTQTLCCHGCGSSVGYMIVIPCSRCTSSITTTNRATNGHRFVFHSNEILSSARHYIADEPGVSPFDAPPFIPASPALPPRFHPPPPSSHRYAHPALPPHAFPPHHYPPQPHTPVSASTSASPSPRSDYLPTPPLELAELSPAASPSADTFSFPFPLTAPPQQNSPLHATAAHAYSHAHAPHTPSPYPVPYSDQKESQPLQRLRDGDLLYWHHLARAGEIPEVDEDGRARHAWRDGRGRVFDR